MKSFGKNMVFKNAELNMLLSCYCLFLLDLFNMFGYGVYLSLLTRVFGLVTPYLDM